MTALSLIIEPAELYSKIQQGLAKNICIVDLSSEAQYRAGHIDGAIFLPFQILLSGKPPAAGKIASKENLERAFSYLGLEDDTHFIVYDDEGGGWAGRFIWTLDAIGHKNYSYLNGGLVAWQKEGFPLETGINTRPENSVSIDINRKPIAEIDDILLGLEQNSLQIWDARSAMEYRGQQITAAKAGHIPGAIHCEWTALMDRSSGLRIREDAKEYLADLGLNGELPVITHCHSHHRSGFTYLVGKSLGFDIRAYHGSWSEWGNHPSTPVEK